MPLIVNPSDLNPFRSFLFHGPRSNWHIMDVSLVPVDGDRDEFRPFRPLPWYPVEMVS